MIKYPLVRGKSYFYIPYGPVLKDFSRELLEVLKTQLLSIAARNDAVFVRLDFTPLAHSDGQNKLLGSLFTKAAEYTYHSAYFQPRIEWFLDLNKSEDELQKGMHEKTRYSIRTAIKRGAVTEILSSDFVKHFPVFYELMCETAKRNGFSLHEKEYYRNIFENLDPTNAYIVLAKFGGKILVVDVFIKYGQVINYVFSGSSSEHRDVLPAYIAQWAAITHAKKLGGRFYNFGGVASGELYKGWEGLTRFKKRFGGFEVKHSDFYDLVSRPLWYYLYNFRKIIKRFLKF
jgi:lipid II:glycine glycyltransferase (peptidoglycan interpeptide bridge formation enzyme)